MELTLKNGTILQVSQVTAAHDFILVRDNQEDVMTAWKSMTEENMEGSILTKDGNVINVFTGLVPNGMQCVPNLGLYTVHMYFRQGSAYVDKAAEYIQAARILLGEVSVE